MNAINNLERLKKEAEEYKKTLIEGEDLIDNENSIKKTKE
jgi:hypothetical protein